MPPGSRGRARSRSTSYRRCPGRARTGRRGSRAPVAGVMRHRRRRRATARSGCRPSGFRPARARRASPATPVRPWRRRRSIAAGRMTPCGPRVAPWLEVTVSMLMTRSWNRWVCSTQPRFTLDAVAERDQVGLGQPVGLAPHAPADLARRGSAARPRAPACRRRRCANHGAATISTNVSTTSLRQTKRAPQRVLAGADPARRRSTWPATVTRGRDGAGGEQHHARTAARRPRDPSVERRAPASATSTPTRDARPCTITGTNRHSSTSGPRDRAAASAGANVRVSSPSAALAAQLHRRAARATTSPAFDFFGRRRQHGDEAVLGTERPGGGHPRVAEERALADLGAADAQPAAAELVGGDHRVVGEEGAVADGGHLRAAAARSTPRRPRRPSAPSARSHTGVSRLA